MPKFSVIIPIYNVDKFLKECLDSAVNQTFGDIEIIGIDDGSTDDSGKILDEYAAKDKRVIAVHQENQGISCARNKGLAIAKGEYITFIDSDDYWRKDTLQILHDRLQEDDFDMLFLGGINFDNQSKELQEVGVYQFDYLPPDFNYEIFSYRDCEDFIMKIAVCAWSKCYKREFLQQNKIVFPPHLFFEDNIFYVQAFLAAKKCGICKEILYFRRIHPASVTQNWNKYYDDYITVCKKVIDYVKESSVSDAIKQKYCSAYAKRPQILYNRFDTADQEKYRVHLKSFLEYYKMKKKKSTLSIITICYNIKDEIERTCESIVNQTWQDFEWIVVDGGSTDGTVEVLKKYQDRMAVFISEKDKGVYNAMNKGIVHAQGEWLNFMNGGDCYINHDVLEKVFGSKSYNADVLYGWTYMAKSKVWRKYPEKLTMTWLCSNPLGHQAMFIQKQCFDRYGLYDETFKIAADHERNVCFLYNGQQFEYLPFGVSFFAEDGISSVGNRLPILINEWSEIYHRYYTEEDVLKYGREYCKPYFLHPIISLTSFPARIDTVNQTIKTLLNQTVKAKKIVLWLADSQFPNKEKDLPRKLLCLRKKGLSIEWCKDLRSFKKLIPALQEYPEDIIVTADDDILYPENWLELLLKGYLGNPDIISCHRAHTVKYDSHGKIQPYGQWRGKCRLSVPSYLNFPTSGAGCLYPPHCLHRDVMNIKKFQKLCPQADDIWFWGMAVLKGTKIKIVKNNISNLKYVPGTQEADTCLWRTNNGQHLNDVQVRNFLKAYPRVLRRVLNEPKPDIFKTENLSKYRLFGFMPLLTIEEK